MRSLPAEASFQVGNNSCSMDTRVNKLLSDGPMTGHFIAEVHTVVPIEEDANVALGQSEVGQEEEEVSVVHDRSAEADYSLAFIRQQFGPDVACLCAGLNGLLSDSALARPYLPLTEESVFDKLQNGIVLCAAANAVAAGTLAESQVYLGDHLADIELGEVHAHQNVNLALRSLELVGVVTRSYEAANLCGGSALPFIGILLQVVRAAMLGRLGPEHNASLLAALDSGSSPSSSEDGGGGGQLAGLSQEQLLKRWVNHQLAKAAASGGVLELKDFGSSLADSVIYATLLDTVAPADQRAALTPVSEVMAVKDPVERAALMLRNASALGLADVIAPEHVASAGLGEPASSARCVRIRVLNVAFLCQIFARYPNLDDAPAQPEKSQAQQLQDATVDALRVWLNSYGVSPIVYSLDVDLRSGLVLLEVLSILSPSSVNWAKVDLGSNDANVSRRKFQWLANCTAALGCARQLGIPACGCSASDLATGDAKSTQALLLAMMRLHSLVQRRRAIDGTPASDLDDKALVKWANETVAQFGESFRLRDLGDPGLRETTALGFLGERVLSEAGRYCPESRVTPVTTEQELAALEGSSGGRGRPEAWLFPGVARVPRDEPSQDGYSSKALLLFRRCGVHVYARVLGPGTHTAVFRDVLLQLRTCMSWV